MLAPVEDGPGDLARVPLEEVRLEAAALQELECLAVGLDEGPPPTGVDLVPGVRAQVDPDENQDQGVSAQIFGVAGQ